MSLEHGEEMEKLRNISTLTKSLKLELHHYVPSEEWRNVVGVSGRQTELTNNSGTLTNTMPCGSKC